MIFDVDETEHQGMYELVEPKSNAKAELKGLGRCDRFHDDGLYMRVGF